MYRIRPTIPLLLILGVVAAGCELVSDAPGLVSATEEVCEQLALEQSIELGTGGDGFIPLEDGDLVMQAWGPQGGDHVWGALRMTGIFGGGAWRDDPDCADGEGVGCGPIAPEDAPTAMINLWHNDILVASTGEALSFQADQGLAIGLIAILNSPYSSAAMECADPSEISQEVLAAAQAAEAADLQFEVIVRDACGAELTDERTVRLAIEWLETIGVSC